MPNVERDPRRWLILIVLCLSTLVLVIDNMVLNVAIPALTDDLGATAQDIQWFLEGYVLTFAGLLLPAGSLSDRYGRRLIMIIGLAVFGASSLIATFAVSPVQLIGARALMGVGGALVLPSTLSILITVFDETERRKAMSAWSAVSMVGLIGGPLFGGVLITAFWWGAVFLINVPISLLAIVAAAALMPESKAPWRKPDPLGAALSVVGMTALVWAINAWPDGGLAKPTTLGALVVAVLGLGVFLWWQARATEPTVPLELFRDRNFSGACFSLVLVAFASSGLILVLTQYLQLVLGYSPSESGLVYLPMAAASVAANTLTGTLSQKISNRVLLVAGLLAIAAGFGSLTLASPSNGFVVVTTGLVLIGVGGGLASPAATSALMGAVPQEHAGVGSALNNTVRQGGAVLGVAVLGSVLAAAFTGAMPASAPDRARDSISGAIEVAEKTGDPALAESAKEAFTNAMLVTSVAGVCGAVAAAALAFVTIRDSNPELMEKQPAEKR